MAATVKKMIATLIVTAVIISVLGAVTRAEEKKLTVLGDSIATGYGLDDYKPAASPKSNTSWSHLLAEQTGFIETNLARDGATLSDLNTSMKTDLFKSAVSEADLIVISIGANDMIQLAVSLISPDIQITDPSGISLLFAELAKNVTAVEEQLPTLLENMNSGYNELFSALKAQNGDAAIIIETIYNPYEMWNMQIQTYTEVYKMKDLMRGWINRANEVIRTVADEYGIYIADVYTAFQNEQTGKYLYAYCASTTAMMSGDFNGDPHPTVYGHAEIFRVYSELITENNLFKTENTTNPVITDPVTTDTVTTDTVTTDTVTTDTVTTDTVTTDTFTTDNITTDSVITETITTALETTDPTATDTVATDTVATDTVATDTVATDTVATDTVATDTVAADTSTSGSGKAEQNAAIIPAVIIIVFVIAAAVTAAVVLIIKKNKIPDKKPEGEK